MPISRNSCGRSIIQRNYSPGDTKRETRPVFNGSQSPGYPIKPNNENTKYVTALRLCSFVALVTLLILSSRRHSLLWKIHGYVTFTETTRQLGQGREGISLGTVSETSNDMEFPQNITEVSNRKNLSQRRTPAEKLPSSSLRQCHLNGIAVVSRNLDCRKRSLELGS